MRLTCRFSDAQLEIVRFCAVECRLQMSGEESVAWMVNAWTFAMGAKEPPTEDDVLMLGRLVEPSRNERGYRRVGVRVGSDVKGDWRLVPRQMANLCTADAVAALGPAEWFRDYEEVHPFVDGNGRTGQILFNWLNGTLDAPQWAPNFWDDWRRVVGAGA